MRTILDEVAEAEAEAGAGAGAEAEAEARQRFGHNATFKSINSEVEHASMFTSMMLKEE